MGRQWFVGTTRQGKETLAKRELEKQQFETYLPLLIYEWSRQPRIRPFLQNYIFILMDPDNQRWRAIFSTFGMKSVLCCGDHPQAIPEWIVTGIKEREVDGLVRLPPKFQTKFKSGDVVRIKGSPLDAVFDEVLDHRRAAVFLSLLGQSHRKIIDLSRLALSPSAPAVASL